MVCIDSGAANNHSALSAKYNRDWKRWIEQNPNAKAPAILAFNWKVVAKYKSDYRC